MGHQTGEMVRKFLIVALLSSPYLFINAVAAQSAPSPSTSASVPAFNHNPASFDFWVGQDAQVVRTVDVTIKCGLVPKSAMAILLAGDVKQLLGQAKSSFGNGQTISYAGAAAFHQAVNGLYQLAEQVTLADAKPSSATCSNARNSQLPAVIERSINQGIF